MPGQTPKFLKGPSEEKARDGDRPGEPSPAGESSAPATARSPAADAGPPIRAEGASAQSAHPPLRPHPILTRYYGDEAQRRRRVDEWFDASAPDYDWITQAMSFGSGHHYRRQALLRAGLQPGMRVLDVACGTGVLAAHAQALTGTDGVVVGLDPSSGMLSQAARRGVKGLVRGLAEALPLRQGGFDLLSMGYALRHVGDLRETFREYKRVLKPGGRILILEITPPRSRLLFHMLKLYLGRIVPLMAGFGRAGRSSRTLMEYYWETIEQCVAPEVILASMEEAGFECPMRHVELGIFSEYTASVPDPEGPATAAH